MVFDFEQFVPRERAIIFSERMAASSRTLFQIVREYLGPHFLLYQIEFGDNLCWMGFRTAETGDEERGWVRIESGLGVKIPGVPGYHPLNTPPIDVGSVTIRSLSPVASRVLIRTNYTPEALSNLFKGLAQYLIWVVNGEEAREALSRALSGNNIKPVSQIEAGEIPLLEAPREAMERQEATEQTRDVETPPTGQTAVQKSRGRAKPRKTRKRPRRAKASSSQRAEEKIFVPSNPRFFERYRKMWRIIQQTQRDYLDLSIKGENERPNPTLDVLREAIADTLRFKPSEKTVRRVILAGSNGLLKKQ